MITFRYQTYYSALGCEVETICGKSIRMGSPFDFTRILNSLKSPWIRPCCASRTIKFIKSEYNFPGSPTSSICLLQFVSLSLCIAHTSTRHPNLQWISIDQLHYHAMPVDIDRFRYRESMFMQNFHKRIFLHSRQARHVHPGSRCTLL